jgi:hypothetical protein
MYLTFGSFDCMDTIIPKFLGPLSKPIRSEDHVWFEDRWMVAFLCDE